MYLVKIPVMAMMALSLTACLSGGPEPAAPAAVAPAPAAPAEPDAAAAPAPEPQTAATVAPAAKPARWGALFIAGDDSIKAFDNATRRFYAIIDGKQDVNLRRLTSDPSTAPTPAEIADTGNIDDALGFVTRSRQENCLLFMTSHGTKDGFYLSQAGDSGGLLPPELLDRWLDTHCGTRPTVVIVSACFSGIFLEHGMAAPNRIILTAARADRPSFGCGAGEVYTYFDKCLLDSWTWVYTWTELYNRTKGCVTERETELGAKPSEPQAYFGAGVANLEMP